MSCDATSLMSTAYSNGYAKLSDRDLKMATLASACAGSGGGGGGGNTVSAADPSGSGTSTGVLWINKNTNNVWYWDGASWIQLIGP